MSEFLNLEKPDQQALNSGSSYEQLSLLNYPVVILAEAYCGSRALLDLGEALSARLGWELLNESELHLITSPSVIIVRPIRGQGACFEIPPLPELLKDTWPVATIVLNQFADLSDPDSDFTDHVSNILASAIAVHIHAEFDFGVHAEEAANPEFVDIVVRLVRSKVKQASDAVVSYTYQQAVMEAG